RSEVNDDVHSYVNTVVTKEWDAPIAEQPNPEAVKDLIKLWIEITQYNPVTEREKELHSAMISSLIQFTDCRRFRITTGRHGIPTILWVVLICSSVITMLFTYFFAADKFAVQLAMTILLAITLSMNTLVVWVLGNPYSGDWKIRPEQYIRSELWVG